MNRHRPSILLVDDEPDFSAGLCDILGELSYDVAVASDGLSALELARVQPFDVAVVDYRLPGMNGVELMAQLRRAQPPARTVLLSAYVSHEVAAAARQTGCHIVLNKPVDLPRLLETVADLLRLDPPSC